MVDSTTCNTDTKTISNSNSYLTNHVRKEGIICIFGSSNCVNWSALVADYILHNLLISNNVNEATKNVICINFDRHDLTPFTINRLFNQPDNSNSSSYSKKLHILNYKLDDEDFSQTTSFQDSILLKIMECMETNQSYDIIIYSLSELILTIGINKTRYFIEKIQSLLTNHNIRLLTHLNFSKYKNNENKCTIILVIHETLHSLYQLAEIQTTFQASTIIKVIPNHGTLSSEVVAEIQTMRISRRSGKLKENIEMFGCKRGSSSGSNSSSNKQTIGGGGSSRLYPLVNIDNSNNNANENMDKEFNIMSPLIDTSVIDTSEMTSYTTTTIETTATMSLGSSNQRIITFDTNDPEFDEDSDPDADLDI